MSVSGMLSVAREEIVQIAGTALSWVWHLEISTLETMLQKKKKKNYVGSETTPYTN